MLKAIEDWLCERLRATILKMVPELIFGSSIITFVVVNVTWHGAGMAQGHTLTSTGGGSCDALLHSVHCFKAVHS